MSNVLVRGLPTGVCKEIQRVANTENLSMNQFLVSLITKAVREMERKEEEEKERAAVFERIEKLREKMYKKYGLFYDSAKLIREDRDSR